jgi:hypothetical protein
MHTVHACMDNAFVLHGIYVGTSAECYEYRSLTHSALSRASINTSGELGAHGRSGVL